MEFDRIYADIYLDRIEKNMEAMQKNLRPGTQLIGVVKADGYGHGAVAVAKLSTRLSPDMRWPRWTRRSS